jgi:Ca2+-binding RTX toxin-like protein
VGSPGADQHAGGAGIDTVDYGASPTGLEVDLAAGTAAAEDDDTVTGLENVVGSAFDDLLFGDDAPNHLDGGKGSDQVVGRGGDDAVYGGSDKFQDFLSGGAGRDLLDLSTSPARMIVDLRAATAKGTGNDILDSLEDVLGSRRADDLRGDDSDNVIVGGAGDDVLDLRGGDDTAVGGDGTDIADGGPGVDQCDVEFAYACE